jgi:hypothetical protein
MSALDELLDRLEQLLADIEQLDGSTRETVFDLLDGIDMLHRSALVRLAARLEPTQLRQLSDEEPAVAWLLEAYDVAIPEPARPTPVQLGPTRRR